MAEVVTRYPSGLVVYDQTDEQGVVCSSVSAIERPWWEVTPEQYAKARADLALHRQRQRREGRVWTVEKARAKLNEGA